MVTQSGHDQPASGVNVNGDLRTKTMAFRNLGVWISAFLALTAWLSTSGGTLAVLALLAAFFYLLGQSGFRRDPAVIAVIVWAIYVLARTVYPDSSEQDTLSARWLDAANWWQLVAFLPVAWFVRGRTRLVHLILLTALAGLMLGLLFKSHWSEILKGHWHERTGFHLSIAYSGFIHSIAILGLIVFAPRLFRTPGRWLRAGWVVLLVVSTLAVLVSQSRQTWLMDIVLIPIAVVTVIVLNLRTQTEPQSRCLWPFLLAGALILTVTGLNHKLITKRVHEEKTAISSIIAHEQPEQLPRTSLGYRYNVMMFGYEKWLEKPWMGWGTGSSKYFIEHSGNPLLIYQEPGKPTIWLRHFHNLYLEVLIRFGIVGMACGGVVAFLMVNALFRSYRSGSLPADHLVFFLGSFAMMALYSLFGFPLLHPDGRSFLILFAGLAYSFNPFTHTHEHRTVSAQLR